MRSNPADNSGVVGKRTRVGVGVWWEWVRLIPGVGEEARKTLKAQGGQG